MHRRRSTVQPVPLCWPDIRHSIYKAYLMELDELRKAKN